MIVLVALTASVVPPLTARASSPPASTTDPTQNTSPSQAFLDGCRTMAISTPVIAKASNDACDAAAAGDFTAVWHSEGVSASFVLPGDFDTLSVPLQLLAISNVERVGRGEAPMAGLSTRIDDLTVAAAAADADPAFPLPYDFTWGGGNWAAAGDSALLDDFYWMYDDGLGSFNGDCTPSDQSGCWGHRHDILDASATPLVMGAAVAYDTTPWGTSMATEYLSGDTTDQVDVAPSWATIAATIPAPTSDTTPPERAPPVGVTVGIVAGRHHVRPRRRITVTGSVVTTATRRALPGELVRLWSRHGSRRWRLLRVRRTGTAGRAHFVLHPPVTRRYRLQALATPATRAGHSASLTVQVG